MLGIIIPTKNRSDFIIKQLYYYASVNCPYTIYIGDSSDKEHVDATKSAIDKLRIRLNVVYLLYPDADAPSAMKYLLLEVKEKYSVYTGDDDYLIPNSLGKCIDFLEDNKEYVSVHGQSIVYTLSGDGAYGDITSLGGYRLLDSEFETPSKRLENFLGNYWVVEFSVRLTTNHILVCEQRDIIKDSGFAEVLTNSLTVIMGKSMKIDSLYLVRQVHNLRNQSKGSVLNWICHEDWQPAYHIFHDSVLSTLIKSEKLDYYEAQEKINMIFRSYLYDALDRYSKQQNKGCVLKVIDTVKFIIRLIPGSRVMYRKIKEIFGNRKKDMELNYLLSPSSVYHYDFMPAYQVIVKSRDSVYLDLERVANDNY